MNAMVPGLAGSKMSSSDPNSKIDFLDTADEVKKKIKKAFCEEGNTENNGLLSFIEAVLIPVSDLRLAQLNGQSITTITDSDRRPFISEDAPEKTVFTIERPEKFGGNMHFSSYAQLKAQFADKAIHPGDLKTAVAASINKLLAPIRKMFEESEEWQTTERLAYPDPNAAKADKKKKKVCALLKGCLSHLCCGFLGKRRR